MNPSPEVRSVIEFGTKAAMEGQTPKAIKIFYRSLMIVSTVWAVIIEPLFLNIPISISHHTDQILLALNTAVYQICYRFGWVVDGNKKTEV